MQVFLAKTDPETFSIDDFVKEGVTYWDGVHNYQAINVIKQWVVGDLVLIYHSMGKAKIVGIAKVLTPPQQNLNDTRFSFASNLQLITVFKNEISLKRIKETKLFEDFSLVKQSRLSVMKCTDNFTNWLLHESEEFRLVYNKYNVSNLD